MARLKAAYEANRIPVDEATAKHHKTMSTYCLLENTLYWEAKARGANPHEAITTAEALALLGASRGRDGLPSGASCRISRECVAAAERQYHGSYVE